MTEERVGWVPPPDSGRGTLQLLASCGLTTLLSTWSAIHPNVPAKCDSAWTVFIRKLKWMLVAMICPEYVTVVAVTEWWDARFLRKEMQEICGSQVSPTLFCSGHGTRATLKSGSQFRQPYSMTQSFFAIMGGYALQPNNSNDLVRLDGYNFYTLMKSGAIQPPTLSTSNINDRSKSDWLGKSITCLQICWLIIQLIGHAIQHLPITTLELFTLALALCALITYGFWWNKPLDVLEPVVIATPLDERTLQDMMWYRESSTHIDINTVRFRRWGINHINPPIVIIALAVVWTYKACFLLAWNFSFPSLAEQYIWRSIVLSSTGLATAWAFIFYRHPNNRWDQGGTLRDGYMFLLYFLCRLYVFCEIFLYLRSAPLGVYETVAWEQYIPHL